MLIGKMQVLKFHSPVAENIKYLISDFELDVISVSKSGMLCEFEVKISRGDFKADAKKRKHVFYSQKPELSPNYFSYACPKDLIKVSEIGTGVGLYYVDNGEVIEVQAPKRLHAKIHDRIKILEKICRVNSERQFLGACRLTYENKELIKRTAKYFTKPVSVMPDLISHNNINTMNKNLSFGVALEAAKQGQLVAREGWNGKDMFVFMRPADNIAIGSIAMIKSLPQPVKNYFSAKAVKSPSDENPGSEKAPGMEPVKFTAYLCMKAADGSIVNGWLASQTDMIAEDWTILEIDE